MYMNIPLSQAYLESHKCFFRYLDMAAKCEKEPSAACGDPSRGYFRERAAWIDNLLALDEYRGGCLRNDAMRRQHSFQAGLPHAREAMRLFDGGFNDQGQGIPTRLLETLLEQGSCDAGDGPPIPRPAGGN
jgi:hypothetical protein